ncbi:MAG: hypothetical protein Q7S26_01600 [bacterium]|nr:hypothetical protein [bacterium]
MSLKNIATGELAAELRTRNDLFDAEGFMLYELYLLVAAIQPIPCVDGVAVRRRNGVVEALAIVRGTGKERGKWCSVGGKIRKNESKADALRRHFLTDLKCGIEMLVPWDQPVIGLQCANQQDVGNNPDFGPEYGKHTVSDYYPVRLLDEPEFGKTVVGGQEAIGYAWFSKETLPPREAFGFDQGPKFIACLEVAEKLV